MTKVFLLCSGLGRINRGFESFTQECFDALAGSPELDLTLFKGGGMPGPRQVVVPNLPRTHPLALRLGTLTRKSGYWVEQVTFTLSLLPHIARQKPDVIYFSDTNVGNLLWHWRRLSRQTFALLFSNGGPMQPPYPRWDFVQQMSPTVAAEALTAGHPTSRQDLVPYGFQMPARLDDASAARKAQVRAELGLPANRPLVLSVGAVNSRQKRMDYVVRELAALPLLRPFLLLVGQQDEGTPEVAALARDLLGDDNFRIETVAHDKVANYYESADAFVLASLHEGFGRVFVEAMSHGLPCLAHDYAQTRTLLGNTGFFADFQRPGQLTSLFCGLLESLPAETAELKAARHLSVYERFSWQRLAPAYVVMIRRAAVSRQEAS